ncbi:S8 family serine peptidase [candidate division GN15 bacterium]|nr:S8 family serine peptidase [candidate division GN15 bacterium]
MYSNSIPKGFIVFLLCLVALPSISYSQFSTWRNEYGDTITANECTNKGGEYSRDELLLALDSKAIDLDGWYIAKAEDVVLDDDVKKLLSLFGTTKLVKVFGADASSDETARRLGLDGFVRADFGCNIDIESVCRALTRFDCVIFAEPNYTIDTKDTDHVRGDSPMGLSDVDKSTNDLDWLDQRNLFDDEAGIGCPTAWSYSRGDPSVLLGNVEKRIKGDHYDLTLANGRYYSKSQGVITEGPLWGSDGSHATHSAGIMCAKTDNARGVAGVAGGGASTDGCGLVCVQIQAPFQMDVIAFAIKRAASSRGLGCHVLNFSFRYPCYSETLRGAIAYANEKNVNIVVSKGNNGNSSFGVPADLDYGWVTSVGSFGQDGLYCTDNSSGGNCDNPTNFGLGIDLLAPGQDYPTTSTLTSSAYVDTLLFSYGGTSGAAPHVAGAIGLLRSYLGNSYRPEDYEEILKLTSRDEVHGGSDGDSLTWNDKYGHGCLEVGNALERLSVCSLVRYTVSGGTGSAYTDTLSNFRFVSGPYQTGYKVIPYKVEAEINYAGDFSSRPQIWGSNSIPFPYATAGFSGASPNYGSPFSCVYDSTVTTSSCKAWTFVYKIHSPSGQFLEWYPTSPSLVPISCIALKPVVKEPDGPVGDIKLDSDRVVDAGDLRFNASVAGEARIDIYDIRGRHVRTLYDGHAGVGDLFVPWDGLTGSGVRASSGIYLLRGRVGGKPVHCRVIVMH